AARHTFLFNTALAEPLIGKIVLRAGVKVHFESRAIDVIRENGRIRGVKLQDGSTVPGDSFVDCTGTRGGVAVCHKYGKGCVMCLVRCPSFGDRQGLVEKAGGKVFHRSRPDGTPGVLSSAVALYKDTLAPWLKAKVEKEGLVKIPLPEHLVDYSKVAIMGASRPRDFVENIFLGDIGAVAKCFGIVYMAQQKLRHVPGFENVQVEDPRASGWNHIGHIDIAERNGFLQAEGIENLFCGGEKAGHGSVDGAIMSGYLAGHNAARNAFGVEPLGLPRSLAIGDWISVVTEEYKTDEGRKKQYRMYHGEYWRRMQELGLYTDDVVKIEKRVKETGLSGILNRKL
ncbi:MAG: FAD-dependent oxidoreductase, partial [Dehalococcoidia bacterium]|nr:FAD-dependent oxidoreductase [Dehalococcoidia bacterium]